MARMRRIKRNPESRNYFVVDACFMGNKYIPPRLAPNQHERRRIERCLEWWEEIDDQLQRGKARVYIPDICIAETFKVLAKKYFKDHWFASPAQLDYYRGKLRRDLVTSPSEMRRFSRNVKYHDISTSRDIIISVDRYFELFLTHNLNVSLPDLIILATAKYLMDFYDIPRTNLHIVTLDYSLWLGSKKAQDLPNAYDPTKPGDKRDRVFE